jgi:hypothetical protein
VIARLLAAAVALALALVSLPASAGYTHYWIWHVTPDASALDACVGEMARIADARRDILADDHDRTGSSAVFRGERPLARDGGPPLPSLWLNGIGDDAHEPFLFPLAWDDDPSFCFVKTQWKPYDEVVVACLIVARDHFPESALEIRSDGEWEPSWSAGRNLYERVLGRPARNPLSPGQYGDGATETVDREEPRSVTKNLLISAVVFLVLGALYGLTRRG